jgi:hypothetical protein
MTSAEIIALVVMTAIGVAAIVVLEIMRPGIDNSATVLQIVSIVVPTSMALIAAMKSASAVTASSSNSVQIAAVHGELKENSAATAATAATLNTLAATNFSPPTPIPAPPIVIVNEPGTGKV